MSDQWQNGVFVRAADLGTSATPGPTFWPHRHRWTKVVTASRGDRTVGITVYCGRCPKRRHFDIERGSR